IFIPRRQGQRDPYGASINQKLDIYRVCMPGGNGDNQRLINTVDLLLGPAIEGVEIAIHGNKTIPISPEKRQFADHDFAAKKFTGRSLPIRLPTGARRVIRRLDLPWAETPWLRCG